jgi:hypothetical protein
MEDRYMFTVDETPAHVVATPAAHAHLRTLAEARGDVTVLLTEHGAAVLKAGQQPPAGTVYLGQLDDAADITCVADDSVTRAWWRTRAHLDLSDGFEMTYDLSNLNERELFEVLAAGPLPRY